MSQGEDRLEDQGRGAPGIDLGIVTMQQREAARSIRDRPVEGYFMAALAQALRVPIGLGILGHKRGARAPVASPEYCTVSEATAVVPLTHGDRRAARVANWVTLAPEVDGRAGGWGICLQGRPPVHTILRRT